MMKLLYDTEERHERENPEPAPFRWSRLEIEQPAAPPQDGSETTGGIESFPVKSEAEERRDALEEALAEKRREAEELLEESRREAEVIREEARRKGYEEGKKTGYGVGLKEGTEEGYVEYQKKADELETHFADFLKEAEKAKQRMLEEHLQDLKEIALAIGEKIVRISLRTNSDVVERMILASTEKLKKSAWAKIYIDDAQDSKRIQTDAKFLQELSYLSDHIKIVMMDGMEPGTCIIERPDEIIDISVGTQLENIREIMNNARL